MKKILSIGAFLVFALGIFSYSAPYVFAATSTVSSVSPNFGPAAGGTAVTIIGTNFTTPTTTIVDFGGIAATAFTVVSSTSISATSSAGAGMVDVTVVNASGTSALGAQDHFTYVPTVTSLSVNHGAAAGGTSTTITGTGFSVSSTVSFGGVLASSTDNSSTSMSATSTVGSGTVDITVANGTSTSATSSADQFTYIPVSTGPVPVNIGTAGNFAILAETLISTTGSTTITGDIGVSPGAATFITGFSLTEASSTEFSTSTYVIGNVYAANYSDPTPANLTTAVGDMGTAYTTAMGVTTPAPVVNAGSGGSLAGLTLYPGVYEFNTDVTIPTPGVTLDCLGDSSSTFIFQISGGLNLESGSSINLTDCQPKNIIWAVSGVANLGTTSVFNGIILAGPSGEITMQNGAVLNGRALSQTAVTLISDTVTAPSGAPVTLSSIAITTPATKLSYTVGDTLDLAGLVVTGTYSDGSTLPEPVTATDVTGFSSSAPATGQLLTITYGGKTTTYTVDINALPVVSSNGGGGGGGGGSSGGISVPIYTVAINGGATTTVSPSVTLSLTTIAGENLMWISNTSTFATSTGTGWIPFQQTYPWTLGVTSGNATVYAEFGNASTSTPAGTAEDYITVGSGGSSGTSVSGVTYASQTQLLNSLIAQLQTLLGQAQAQGMALTPAETAYLNMSTTPTLSTITRDLTVGLRGADVSALQAFLISQAKGSAASTLSAAGATGYFGQLTKAALAEYQKSVGVTPSSGYFGPITREYLKNAGF